MKKKNQTFKHNFVITACVISLSLSQFAHRSVSVVSAHQLRNSPLPETWHTVDIVIRK